MKQFAFLTFFATLAVVVRSMPIEYTTTEANTETEAPTEAMYHHHVSKYQAKLSTEHIKGSIGCTENNTLFFTNEWIKHAYFCKDPEIWGEKSLNCKFFCEGHSVGILDEQGMPSKERYDEYIDLAIPEQHRRPAKEIVHACLQTLGHKIDPQDPDCEGAGLFNECVFKIFGLTC